MISLRILEGSLGVVFIACVLLASASAASGVCRGPDSLAGLALILSSSSRFIDAVRNTGCWSSKRYRSLLTGSHYWTAAEILHKRPDFRLETDLLYVTKACDMGKPFRMSNSEEDWWQPFPTKIHGRLLTIFVTISVVVVLIFLFFTSRSNNGIANINTDSARYAYTYTPPLAMASVAALYASLDSSIKILQPYHRLKRAPCHPEDVAHRRFPGRLLIFDVWNMASQRQYAVLATSLAAMLAPTLTISVSGLYQTEIFSTQHSVRVQPREHFDISVKQSSGFSDKKFLAYSTLLVTGVTELNMSFPSWTFENLAFSAIELPWGGIPSDKRLEFNHA